MPNRLGQWTLSDVTKGVFDLRHAHWVHSETMLDSHRCRIAHGALQDCTAMSQASQHRLDPALQASCVVELHVRQQHSHNAHMRSDRHNFTSNCCGLACTNLILDDVTLPAQTFWTKSLLSAVCFLIHAVLHPQIRYSWHLSFFTKLESVCCFVIISSMIL